MSDLKKKIAYLQGLAEGLNVDNGSKEGRVLIGIIDVLDEMAEQMEYMEDAQMDIEEYVETIDEDLYELENDIHSDMDDMEDLEDMEYVEVECPGCGDVVYFDADIMDDEDLIEVTCPNCEEVVYINDEDALEVMEDDYMGGTVESDIAMNKNTKDTEDI